MCGFAGMIHPSLEGGRLQKILKNMLDTIVHRGPDGEGMWFDHSQGVALGHRRLALIDLSEAGAQPMISACGRYVMIYNGEVYNDDVLRPLLIEKGIIFRGHSDTEVILEACAHLGLDATLSHLNGMFAFALYDRVEQSLILARDRTGIKPLYWTQDRGDLAFSSELRAFWPLFETKPPLNQSAVSSYLRYGYVPTPHTIFQGIHKLEPGHYLVHHNGAVQKHCYWSMDRVASQPLTSLSEAEAYDALHGLLKDSVKRCMVADVPVGSFLSGGIDSSLVSALMQTQSAKPIQTFTIGFHDHAFNEASYAKTVAAHLGTNHQELYVTSKEAQALVPELSSIYDEPFSDSSAIPTLILSKLTKTHVKTALSGDGGDEVFAGYNRYQLAQKIWGVCRSIPFPSVMSNMIASVPSWVWDQLACVLPASKRPQQIGYRAHQFAALLKAQSLEAFYTHFISQCHFVDKLRPFHKELHPQTYEIPQSMQRLDFIQQMQLIDTKTYMMDDILVKVDKASMAHSLEARVPLLDHRVIEMAWTFPTNWKIKNQSPWKIKNQSTKNPLRHILSQYVPKELFERPKMGFGIPLKSWLRGDLKSWAEDLLFDPSLKEWCDEPFVHGLWKDFITGAQDHQYALWTILMFQSWKVRWGI